MLNKFKPGTMLFPGLNKVNILFLEKELIKLSAFIGVEANIVHSFMAYVEPLIEAERRCISCHWLKSS